MFRNKMGIIVRDIIRGVDYIQSKGIMHRDIKP